MKEKLPVIKAIGVLRIEIDISLGVSWMLICDRTPIRECICYRRARINEPSRLKCLSEIEGVRIVEDHVAFQLSVARHLYVNALVEQRAHEKAYQRMIKIVEMV